MSMTKIQEYAAMGDHESIAMAQFLFLQYMIRADMYARVSEHQFRYSLYHPYEIEFIVLIIKYDKNRIRFRLPKQHAQAFSKVAKWIWQSVGENGWNTQHLFNIINNWHIVEFLEHLHKPDIHVGSVWLIHSP